MWFHKYLSLKGYCNSNIPKIHKRIKKDGKIFFHYRINSYTFNNLNWIYDMFYKWDKKYIKIIPSEEYLSPFVLAIWFLDYGSKGGS